MNIDVLHLLGERDPGEFNALRAVLKARMKEARQGKSIPFDSALREGIRWRGMKRLEAKKAH